MVVGEGEDHEVPRGWDSRLLGKVTRHVEAPHGRIGLLLAFSVEISVETEVQGGTDSGRKAWRLTQGLVATKLVLESGVKEPAASEPGAWT